MGRESLCCGPLDSEAQASLLASVDTTAVLSFAVPHCILPQLLRPLVAAYYALRAVGGTAKSPARFVRCCDLHLQTASDSRAALAALNRATAAPGDSKHSVTRCEELSITTEGRNCFKDLSRELQGLIGLKSLDLSLAEGLDSDLDRRLIATLAPLAALEKIVFARADAVTDAVVSALAQLPRLRDLCIEGCGGVTSLSPLSEAPALQVLNAEQCNGLTELFTNPPPALTSLSVAEVDALGAAAFMPIARCRSLRVLNASLCNGVTTSLLRRIGSATPLTELRLDGAESLGSNWPSVVAALPALETLGLTACQADEATIAPLVHCTRLKQLDADANPGLDASAAALIAQCLSLEYLNVSDGDNVCDAFVAALAPLQRLKALAVRNCESLTDAALASIARLRALQTLDISANKFTDVGVSSLAPLTALTTLRLGATRGSFTGSTIAATLPALQHLSLSFSNVTIQDAVNTLRLPSLTELDVAECGRVFGSATAALIPASMPALRKLDVSHIRIRDPDVLRRLAAVPTLRTLLLLGDIGVSVSSLSALVASASLETVVVSLPDRPTHFPLPLRRLIRFG